ncbi:MAG TPA: DUF6252 family protein [Vicinamibacterales bacterium]|jgi:hypothetical protein|nr:DUF6252 family protein [Vicinamibacterales bacterium]
MTRKLCLVAAILIASISCGGGDDGGPADPSGGSGSGSGSKGTVTALIEGVSYSGAVNSAKITNGTLNIASNSSDLTRAIAFALKNAAVGTYSTPNSEVSFTVQVTNGATVTGAWGAGGQLGSGTLTISSISSSSVSGTFNFVGIVPAGSPGTGTKTVTNGSFSATF